MVKLNGAIIGHLAELKVMKFKIYIYNPGSHTDGNMIPLYVCDMQTDKPQKAIKQSTPNGLKQMVCI